MSKWPVPIRKSDHHHQATKCKLKLQYDATEIKKMGNTSVGEDMEQLELS